MNPVIKFQLKKGRYTEMKHWNKEVAKEINPQITIKITKEDVVDILSSAIGGIGYWGEIVPNDRQYEETRDWLRKNAESAMKRSSRKYSSMASRLRFEILRTAKNLGFLCQISQEESKQHSEKDITAATTGSSRMATVSENGILKPHRLIRKFPMLSFSSPSGEKSFTAK